MIPPDPSARLGRFVVLGGSITYDDARSGEHEIIDGIDVNFAWPSSQQPAAGSGRFIWRGETVAFNAAVGAPIALMKGNVSPLRFAVTATPIRLSFNGTAINLSDMQLNGQTSISTPSIRRLMAWLGTPVGEGATFGAAAIRGKLTWVKPAAAFDDARMELDGNQAEGAIAVTFGDKPKIEGTLAFQKLDLTAYLEAFAREPLRERPVAFGAGAPALRGGRPRPSSFRRRDFGRLGAARPHRRCRQHRRRQVHAHRRRSAILRRAGGGAAVGGDERRCPGGERRSEAR